MSSLKSTCLLMVCFICSLHPRFSSGQETNDKIYQSTDSYISTLVEHAKKFYGRNSDSLLNYGNRILTYSNQKKNVIGMAEAYNILGVASQDMGKTAVAIDYFRKGLEIAKGTDLNKIRSALLLNKGNSEEGIGNYVTALDHYLESVKLKEKFSDSLGMAKCLNNIAQIYSRQGNSREALENFFASLKIKQQYGDTVSIAKTYNNIAVTYNNLQEYNEALKYLELARQGYTSAGKNSEIPMLLGNIAWTYDLMGKKDTALLNYLEALKILEAQGNAYDVVVTRINTGSLLLEMNDLDKAEAFLLRGMEEARALNSQEDMREAYHYLAVLYETKKDFRKAFEFQKLYQAVSDSILNEEKATTLAEMHVRYESEKKEEQNKLLLKENELQGARLERNRYMNAGLVLFALLILVIAVLFIKQARLSARQQAMTLEQKVLRSQMNPHFIFNSLQSIQGFIFENSALEAGKYLSDFARLMRLILENSKSEYITLSREIETLNYYLLLQQLRFSNKLEYSLVVDQQINPEAYLVPPMILQPIIENAIEHGIRMKNEKGKVSISIHCKGDYFIFVVEDDGVGRNYKNEPAQNGSSAHKSLATEITLERLELINKKSIQKINMKITDLHNPTGTRVEFNIPVKEAV